MTEAEHPTDRPRTGLSNDIHELIADAVKRRPGVDGIGCLLMDGEGTLRYVSATDRSSSLLEVAEELALEGPCHDAFLVGEALARDIRSDQRYNRLSSLLGTTGIRTVIGAPILLEGAPIGALDAHTAEDVDWGSAELTELRRDAAAVSELLQQTLAQDTDADEDPLAAQIRVALLKRAILDEAAGVLTEDAGLSRSAAARRVRQISGATGVPAVAVAQQIVRRGREPALTEILALVKADRRHREEVALLAMTDPLTGLANRTRLLDRIDQALKRSDRSGHAPILLFADLDRFKTINDTLGHEVGDQVLCTVADRLAHTMRAQDTVARLGGDEFAVLCETVDGDIAPESMGERVVAAFREPIIVRVADTLSEGEEEHRLLVHASVGICVPELPARASDVLRDADMAMYSAKRSGDAVTMSTQSLRASSHRTVRLGQSLRQLLETNRSQDGSPLPDGLSLGYEPLVEIENGLITSLEALIRWDHEIYGAVPAEELIRIAEETGLMVALGRAILRQALTDAAGWRTQLQHLNAAGAEPLIIAVNTSPQQLAHPRFHEHVTEALADTDTRPGALCLEITESRMLETTGSAMTTIAALHADGVNLTVDDFGTGYSSLSYLSRLPIQQIKVDRSFVSTMVDDHRNHAVVASVLALGRTLGLRTVGEGVETTEQEQALRDMGCDLAQGHLYHAAVPAPDVPGMVMARGLSSLPRP